MLAAMQAHITTSSLALTITTPVARMYEALLHGDHMIAVASHCYSQEELADQSTKTKAVACSSRVGSRQR